MTVDPTSRPRGVLYGWYVVIVLMLCQTLASLDANLPFILVE